MSQVFIYQGTVKCFQFPFVLLFAIGLVLLVVLGALLPSYQLHLVYRPGVSIMMYTCDSIRDIVYVYTMRIGLYIATRLDHSKLLVEHLKS